MAGEEKCTVGQNGRCCSSVEQVFWKKGGQGMRDEAVQGWKISQVESLIGMPRRDIQRACYDGAGGLGIVRPRNTAWGWRVYEVRDVAKLFLLARNRSGSRAINDIRREFAECDSDRGLRARLLCCERQFRDMRDESAGVALAARALACTLDCEGMDASFPEMIDAAFAESVRDWGRVHEALSLASRCFLSNFLERIACVKRSGSGPDCADAKGACAFAVDELGRALGVGPDDAAAAFAQALNAPGVALACELWQGPSSHAFANEALEATLVAMEECAPDKRAKH